MSTIPNYGSFDPADDGSQVEANKVKFSTVKSSLTNPIKTFVEAHLEVAKFNATAAPTITDDSGDSYGVGSVWIDVTNDRAYICVDATAGAAVWREIYGKKHNFAGSAAPTATDDTGDGYEVGSLWFDTTNDKAHFCVDATAGAAVWVSTGGDVVDDATPQLGGNLDCQNNNITSIGTMFIDEQASADADVAGDGQIWVENTTPNKLKFTDDAGTDTTLSGIVLGTEQASTSGTEVSFTSIPSGVKRITFMCEDVSVSGSDNLQIQIGDSGGYETSGYDGCEFHNAANTAILTSGFSFNQYSTGASNTWSCMFILTLKDSTNNTWSALGNSSRTDSNNAESIMGDKSLSGELDRIRLTVDGSNTFDAGSVNIQYEY